MPIVTTCSFWLLITVFYSLAINGWIFIIYDFFFSTEDIEDCWHIMCTCTLPLYMCILWSFFSWRTTGRTNIAAAITLISSRGWYFCSSSKSYIKLLFIKFAFASWHRQGCYKSCRTESNSVALHQKLKVLESTSLYCKYISNCSFTTLKGVH